MKANYGGAESGPGATFDFEGDRNGGSGRLSIVDSRPSNEVRTRLQMVKPIAADHVVVFPLLSNGDATDVTGAMHGPVPDLAKIVHLFPDVDGMVGRGFDTGLAKLKAMVEG